MLLLGGLAPHAEVDVDPLGLSHQLADGVGEVLTLDASERAPNPPTLDEAWRGFSDGVHRRGTDLLVLLDVERLMAIGA